MHWNSWFKSSVLAGLFLGQSFAGTFVQIHLPFGDIDLELYDQDKPETVRNFLSYIQSGSYTNNMVVHRWDPGFVIQGGGFMVTNRTSDAVQIVPMRNTGAITNEYSVGRKFSNTYGTIAMARVGGQTNSATSQWFLNLANNAFLDSVDGGFTVFGKVIGSTNVLERFNRTDTANGIYRADLGGALNHLPVMTASPSYDDLVFARITTLNIHIETSSDANRINWISIKNATNIVEFSTSLPPQWATLVKTNGSGLPYKILDTAPGAKNRFYRVRVEH